MAATPPAANPTASRERRLHLGDFHPDLESAFAASLRRRSPGGDARGLTVVVPNRLLAVHLRRRAAELGTPTLGLSIRALEDLALDLARPRLVRSQVRALEPWMQPLLVTEVLTSRFDLPPLLADTTYFGPLARAGGLYRALAATFRDLRDASIEPDELAAAARAATGPGGSAFARKLAEVVDGYRVFVEALDERRLADRRAVSDRAVEALAAEPGRLPPALFVYGLYDLVDRQRRLLEAMMAGRAVEVFFPQAGEGPAFELLRPMRRWLDRQGFAVESPAGGEGAAGDGEGRVPTHLGALLRDLFAARRSGSRSAAGGLRLLSTPNPPRQATEVLRRTLNEPTSSGVLLRREPSDLDLYRELARRSGVALHAGSGEPWARSPSGRVVSILLDLVRSARPGLGDDGPRPAGGGTGFLSRAAVEELLTSPVLAPALFRPGARPERWAQLLRRQGVVGELDGWRRIARGLPGDGGGAAEVAVGSDEAGARSSAKSFVRRDRLAAAEGAALSEWTGRLLAALAALAAPARRWSRLAARLDGLLGEWLVEGAESEALRRHLGRLAALDGLLAPTLSTLAEAVDKLLAEPRRPADAGDDEAARFGEAPTVGGLMALRGLTFDRLVLPGLVERGFPRRPRQDPILLDAERRLLADAFAELSLDRRLPSKVEGSAAEERFLFRSAIGSARRELILAWPRRDDEGRELVPSTFLLEVASVLAGRDVDFGVLDEPAAGAEGGLPIDWVPLSPFYPTPFDPEAGAAPLLLPSEFDLAAIDRVLARGGKEGAGELSYLLAVYPRFDASLRMDRQRHGVVTRHRLTEYDGRIDPRLAAAWLERRGRRAAAGAPRFSASALERYARCSFSFLHNNVLRIDGEPPPERRLDPDPRRLGDLYHRLLHELYERLERAGLLPLAGERLAAARREIEPALAAVLEGFPGWTERLPAGLWQSRRERLVGDVERLLELEAEETATWRPRRFELAFGLGGPPPVIDAGARRLALSGRIDRLDAAFGARGPGPPALRIVDYKTGRLKEKDYRPGDLQGGRRLQLALYRRALIAAPELAGLETAPGGTGPSIAGVYVGVSSASGHARYQWSDEQFSAVDPELDRLVGGMLAGMAEGELYQVENGYFCDNVCELSSICGPARSRLIEEKKEDPVVARGWRHARGSAEEEP